MIGISASLWSNFQCLEIETKECNTILFSLVFKTIIPYRVNLNHLLRFYTNSGNVDSIPIFLLKKHYINDKRLNILFGPCFVEPFLQSTSNNLLFLLQDKQHLARIK